MAFTFLLTAFVLAVITGGMYFVIQGINQKKPKKVAGMIALLLLFFVVMYFVLRYFTASM